MTRRHLLALMAGTGVGGFLMGDVPSAIAAAAGGNANMRIGTVTAYDANAGTLTVNIAGTLFPGLFYNPAYLPVIGDTVIVLNTGPTWYVIGSSGNSTPRFFPVSQHIAAAETSTSLTFGDLTTFGPSVTVNIGASGKARVTWGCSMQFNANNGGVMGIAVSGANTIAPDWRIFASVNSAGGAWNLGGSRQEIYSGLNPGSTTFTAKYTIGGGTPVSCTFIDRTVTVEAF